MARIQLSIKRYKQALNTWRRMLIFLTNENNELKQRLADILKDTNASAGLMDAAEQYLCIFTRNDEVIRLARADIAALELRLTRENFEQEKAFKRIQEMHRELNNEMEKLEQQFNSSKYNFITFLTAMS